jgi:phage terminase large subunit-like protein
MTSSKPSAVTLSRGPAIDKFFQRYLTFPSGRGAGQPFVMEGWQRRFTNYFHGLRACTPDELVTYGMRRYPYAGEPVARLFRLGILGIPRGNGKSPLAAGYGLFETASRRDASHAYCLSSSKKQADVVYEFARAFVETSALQKHGFRSGRNKITYEKAHAFFEVLTASGLGQHGKNPAVVIGDETHALITAREVETWVAMWTALHKRDDPYALMITTAGFKKDTLLGMTYDEALTLPVANIRHSNPCLRIHEDRENGILFWWYGIPEELHHRWEDPELWRYANPASWISVADLKKQLAAPGFSELDFQRLHLNMWTAAKHLWLRTGLWGSLVGDTDPFPRKTKIWIGVDIGWTDDSSAVVWATRLPNGKIAIRAKIWTVRRDQVGEFMPGGTTDLQVIEDFVAELAGKYRLQEIAYDPSFFGRSIQLLRKRLRLREKQIVEMPPFHAHTRAAWTLLKQYAESGDLEHDGDEDLAAHAAATGEEMTASGPRVTRAASGKIDAMAAGVLAVSRCDLADAVTTKPGLYWMTMDGEQPDLPDPPKERGR